VDSYLDGGFSPQFSIQGIYLGQSTLLVTEKGEFLSEFN
jgi:hypothetical protein